MNDDLVVVGEVAIDELRDTGEVRAGGAAYAADAAASTGAVVLLAGEVPVDLPDYEVRRLRRRNIRFDVAQGKSGTRYVMAGTSPTARRSTERIPGTTVPRLPTRPAKWWVVLASQGLDLTRAIATARELGTRVALDGHDDEVLRPEARPALRDCDVLLINWSTLIALTSERTVEAAVSTLERQNATTIIKHGRGGVTVMHEGRRTQIGALGVRTGIKVGAGDTLAGTTVGLLTQGRPLEDAVRLGVRAAGSFIETGAVPAIAAVTDPGDSTYVAPERMAQEVYVASPFFTYGDLTVIEELEAALEAAGIAYFSPRLRVGILAPGADRAERERVYKEDLAALEVAPAVVAVLDGDDPGTAWEIGYAIAKNKPVVGLRTDARVGPDNMITVSVASEPTIERVVDQLIREIAAA